MSEKLPAPREGLSGKAMRRVVMGSFAGALMEWYDFFIFGTAAGLVFAPLFYPDSDPFIGLIASFATFGVGFLTRPLGGIVFGHFGDKIGRKITLIWTLAIVGCSTFLIGFIPTYQEIGIWAPLVLMVLRLIQGFGLGGEYGSGIDDHRISARIPTRIFRFTPANGCVCGYYAGNRYFCSL